MKDESKTSRVVERVAVRLACQFVGSDFRIDAECRDLSEDGMFLATTERVPPGAQGRLRVKPDSWDAHLEVSAQVVRVVLSQEETAEMPAGIGLHFSGIDAVTHRKLVKWVKGQRTVSIADSIRQNARREGNSLENELRKRSVAQCVVFAPQAQSEEIRTLIRRGNTAVLSRLFDNPRLQVGHVRLMLWDPRLNTTMLLEIRKQRRWFADSEVKTQYCKHPAAPEREVIPMLSGLSVDALSQIQASGVLRVRIRDEAKKILRQRGVNAKASSW